MIPIAFCASPVPCANAIAPADTICSFPKIPFTVAGRARRNVHATPERIAIPSRKPTIGAVKMP